MKKQLLILSLFIALSNLPVEAQAPTVGNATITPLPSKINESYGVTSADSTHQRLGNTTGIGGSTFQTESVTSETRASVGRRFVGGQAQQPSQPELHYQLPLEQPFLTPALSRSSFDNFGGLGINTFNITPTIRTEPFSSNFTFGSQRQPAIEGVHTGQQSFRNLW